MPNKVDTTPEKQEMTREDFAAEVMEWFNDMDPSQHDWAEALLTAAADEHPGDYQAILDSARAAHEKNPDGSSTNDEEDKDNNEEEEQNEPGVNIDDIARAHGLTEKETEALRHELNQADKRPTSH